MDIGPEKPPFIAEPLRDPFRAAPHRETTPDAPEREPAEEPAEPARSSVATRRATATSGPLPSAV